MRIKTQREIFREIIKKYSDDVYDFLQQAQGGREGFLHNIELEFIDKQEEELTTYMKDRLKGIPDLTKDDFEREFIFWTEKSRGYPLDMGEMGDCSERMSSWANDNGYGYLYDDE